MTDRPTNVPRYQRNHESPAPAARERVPLIAESAIGEAIADSSLSPGGKGLTLGLAALASVRAFPGGGLGIEYGSLLKTAVHPAFIADHVAEASTHLRNAAVDVLLIPGMSGYPIGSIYSFAAGIPAILLKKNEIRIDRPIDYSPGAFVIPSYTGEGDVVMTAQASAGRDEDVHENGEAYDLFRSDKSHQSFGTGPHFCQGTHVARMMLVQFMLPLLFDRFPDMELPDPDAVIWRGFGFRGPLNLPVRLN